MRIRIPYITVFIVFILVVNESNAQQYFKRYFTVNEGMPSNRVYKTLEDSKGFLWIATENGLSRFDGQNFRNYSVSDGLPDTDILDIFIDSLQRLWIIPFNRNPAFMDLNTYKIYNVSTNPELSKISVKTGLLGNALSDSTAAFFQYRSHFFIVNGKDVKAFHRNDDRYTLSVKKTNRGYLVLTSATLDYFENGKMVKSLELPVEKVRYGTAVQQQDKMFFITQDSSIACLSGVNENMKPSLEFLNLSSPVVNICNLPGKIGVVTINGQVSLVDSKTLKVIRVLNIDENCKSVSQDKNGAYWLSTDNMGIVKYFVPIIANSVPEKSAKSIAAVQADAMSVVSISTSGDVVETQGNKIIAKTLLSTLDRYATIMPKKIISYGKEHCLITYQGVFKGRSGKFVRIPNTHGLKDAAMLNDHEMLLGAFNTIMKLNLKTNVSDTILSHQRASAICVLPDGNIYFGSNDGLYQLKNNKSIYLAGIDPILSSNITTLYASPDGILWVGLSADTMVAMKQNKILAKIPMKEYFHASVCRTLQGAGKNDVWIGTEKSLGKIVYKVETGTLKYVTRYFDVSDGLGQGQVNNIAIYNNTVYVATNSGVSKLASDAEGKINDVPVYITNILINSKEVDLQGYYELPSAQNNIQMKFSSVDLSEYKPTFEYRINNREWQSISGTDLFISGLDFGEHNVQLRAINRDNKPSHQVATVVFMIKTPLLQRPLFWVLATIAVTGLIFLIYFRQKLMRQRAMFRQDLALANQRQQITADLHDDIGATLSSLQINSAIAAKLMEKDEEKAKTVLSRIETQSRQLSEKIGDFIWSLKPGKEELMTLSSRIRNFANGILGATNINYKIEIDPGIDNVIKDFTGRRNVVMISKEAINNAAKYSQATQLYLSLRQVGRLIILRVADNGVGLDKEKALSGNGLGNMKKRIEELNGTLEIKSEKNKGTEIIASFPAIP